MHRLKDEFPGVRHLDLTRCLGIRNRNLKNILKSKVPIESLALGQDVHKTHVKNQASSALLSNAVSLPSLRSLPYPCKVGKVMMRRGERVVFYDPLVSTPLLPM